MREPGQLAFTPYEARAGDVVRAGAYVTRKNNVLVCQQHEYWKVCNKSLSKLETNRRWMRTYHHDNITGRGRSVDGATLVEGY